MNWQTVIQSISAHWETLGLGSGVLLFAAVSTMPEKIPSSIQECWTWAREALQTAVPAARKPTTNQPAKAEQNVVTAAANQPSKE